MSSVYKLFQSVLRYGLLLMAIGQLPTATRYLALKAFESHQQGLISLGKLNRELQIGGKMNHFKPGKRINSR